MNDAATLHSLARLEALAQRQRGKTTVRKADLICNSLIEQLTDQLTHHSEDQEPEEISRLWAELDYLENNWEKA